MNEALNALYALQQVDSALAQAQKQYQALDQGKAEQAAAESAKEIYERMVRAHHDTARDQQDAELELKTVEAKSKEFEKKLYGGKVTAFKELESIQQEIAALGRQRDRLDERILTLMDQLETRRAEEAEAKAKLDAIEAALAAKQAAFKASARVLSAKAKALMMEREEKVKPIPPALLKRYDSLRAAKHGVGIAKLDGQSCGGCHTSLPSNLVTRVEKTDSVETCENCGRLLCVGE
jgi:predicted  nucleic acid-binding Zn-ribbon protein